MRWSGFFTSAAYSGSSYGAGNLTPGEVGPECLVLHEVRRRLIADEKLLAIFGEDRLYVCDGPDPFDFQNLPKLLIYAADTSEIKAPSSTNVYTVAVNVELKYDPAAIGRIEPGEATVAAVVSRIKEVLKANLQLTTAVGGDGRQMAKNSNAGAALFRYDVDPAGGRYVVAQVLPWIYYLDVNYETGQIRTLE